MFHISLCLRGETSEKFYCLQCSEAYENKIAVYQNKKTKLYINVDAIANVKPLSKLCLVTKGSNAVNLQTSRFYL